MADYRVQLLPDVLRSRDSSTFTGSYQTLGSALTYPTRIMKITNNSDQDILISWNGTDDHEFIPATSFILLDCTANRVADNMLSIASGTQIYVQGSAGTGIVYLSSYYAT